MTQSLYRWLLTLLMLGQAFVGNSLQAQETCIAEYDPTIGKVTIPCISVAGSSPVYAAELRQFDNRNFWLASADDKYISHASVTAVKVLTNPIPIAVITFEIPSPCYYLHSIVQKPGEQDESVVTLAIGLNRQLMCAQVISTATSVIKIEGSFQPQKQYKLTVNGYTSTFSIGD